jgi:hypothetical protein
MRVIGRTISSESSRKRGTPECRHFLYIQMHIRSMSLKQSRQEESTFYIAAKNEIRKILRYIDLYLEIENFFVILYFWITLKYDTFDSI